MRKIFATISAVALVVAMAIPAMANPYKEANRWYFDADKAGTLTAKDDQKTYIYDAVVPGTNFLGLQNDLYGPLVFVSFVADCNCDVEHVWIYDYFEPTCEDSGYWLGICECCGSEWLMPEYNALGHEFINDTGVVIKAATCEQDGILEAACSRCGKIGERVIPALGHNFVRDIDVEIVNVVWNGQNGSNARFDVTLELTFKRHRGGDLVVRRVLEGAYYQNKNSNNLVYTYTGEGYEFSFECVEINVTIALSATGSSQNVEFSLDLPEKLPVGSKLITAWNWICEELQ